MASSIAVQRPWEHGSVAWPVVTEAGQFVLESGELIRWTGRAAVSGLRYIRQADGTGGFEREWSIDDFAHVTLTDRRLLYRGDRLARGAEPTAPPFDRVERNVGRSFVVGHVRHEWVANVMLETQRSFGLLHFGQFEVSFLDENGPLRVTVLVAPTITRPTSGSRARALAETVVRDVARLRLAAGAASPSQADVDALAAQLARPTAVATRHNRWRWDLPAPQEREQLVRPDRQRSGHSAVGGANAVVTAPPGDRSNMLAALGSDLHDRYHRDRHVAGLKEAIRSYRDSLSLIARDDPRFPSRISDLSVLLVHEFDAGLNVASIDEAIEIQRSALLGCLSGTPQQRKLLKTLARALEKRFESGGPVTLVDEAVTINRGLVSEAVPSDGPEYGELLDQLATSLLARLRRTGSISDADEAVELLSSTLALDAASGTAQPGRLSDLGVAHFYRHRRIGDLQDLHDAIRLWRQAVTATPADASGLPSRLGNLANGLWARFGVLGSHDDLIEAISLYRRATASSASNFDLKARAVVLGNMASALIDRFGQTHDQQTWQEAVDAAREAKRLQSILGTGLADSENALTKAFVARGEHLNNVADMDAAVAHARAAAQHIPHGHAQWSIYQSSLAVVLMARFQVTGAPPDLDEAILVGRAAMEVVPPRDPAIAGYIHNQAERLEARYQRHKRTADIQEAIRLWRAAASTDSATTSVRFEAAQARAGALATLGRWHEAADAYEEAIMWLPQLAWPGISWEGREKLLADKASTVAVNAAASCLHIGAPERAIRLLELGRAVIWNLVLDLRTDLTRLEAAAPDLAARLDATQKVLQQTNDITRLQPTSELSPPREYTSVADMRIEAAHRRQATLEAIRQLPGFRDFMLPPPIEELYAAATSGPVVVINISTWRCDAIIITTQAMRVVPLPHVTRDNVINRAVDYLEALQDATTARSGRQRHASERFIAATLEWLWGNVTQPVLDALGCTRSPASGEPWPAIWWSPTGLMTLLPLHAAGDTSKQVHTGCLDRVVSSYTPTLRLLAEGRRSRTSAAAALNSQLLVVALRHTPGQEELPDVDREVSLLSKLMPQRTLLTNSNATKAKVAQALDQHLAVHFSCHASQRLGEPSQGGILLNDGALSVVELANAHRTEADLAFLSACKTAMGGSRLFDQAVSIVGALQHCGWRHVVGTQWSVRDNIAADVTEHIYSEIAEAGALRPEKVAEALHHAIHFQRSMWPDNPSAWVPFIHSGP